MRFIKRWFRPANFPQLIILLVWLVSLVVLLARTVPVSGDGIYYFSYLHSVVIDGDLDFKNELEHFADQNVHVKKQLESGVTTQTGLVHNLYAIGPAILWSPFYLMAHGIAVLGGQTDGYSILEFMAISLATSLYGLLGLGLAFNFLKKVLPITTTTRGRAWSASFSAIAIVLGTSLIFYLVFDTSVAHILGFFMVNLLLWLWLRWRTLPIGKLGWRWILLGLIVGITGLMRWQLLGVALIIPALDLFWHFLKNLNPKNWKAGLRNLAKLGLCGLGAFIAFLPQMFAWKILFGGFLVIPQGRGFINLASPHFFEVLFSGRHGLLTWTPIIILALVGLIIGWIAYYLKKSPNWHKLKTNFAGLALLILLVQIYINGTAIEWWGGEAFGARRFTDISLVFMLGLGVLLQWARPKKWRNWLLGTATVLLIIANLLFLQIYRHGLIPLDEPVSFFGAVQAVGQLLG